MCVFICNQSAPPPGPAGWPGHPHRPARPPPRQDGDRPVPGGCRLYLNVCNTDGCNSLYYSVAPSETCAVPWFLYIVMLYRRALLNPSQNYGHLKSRPPSTTHHYLHLPSTSPPPPPHLHTSSTHTSPPATPPDLHLHHLHLNLTSTCTSTLPPPPPPLHLTRSCGWAPPAPAVPPRPRRSRWRA